MYYGFLVRICKNWIVNFEIIHTIKSYRFLNTLIRPWSECCNFRVIICVEMFITCTAKTIPTVVRYTPVKVDLAWLMILMILRFEQTHITFHTNKSSFSLCLPCTLNHTRYECITRFDESKKKTKKHDAVALADDRARRYIGYKRRTATIILLAYRRRGDEDAWAVNNFEFLITRFTIRHV